MLNFFKDFNKNVGSLGICEASKILVMNLGLKMEVRLKDFPKKGAVLAYSNHPTGIDPFILSSVVGREDFLFLGDVYHLKKGKNISKFVAPVYPTSFSPDLLKRRITNWPGFIYMRMVSPPIDKLIAKKKNKKALDKIIDNIKIGGVSLIFPSGGEYEFLAWKKGIYNIKKILDENKIKYTLYKIRIEKFSEFKLILHLLTFKKLFSNLLIFGNKVTKIIK